MGAITFIEGIPNAKMFDFVTHSICICILCKYDEFQQNMFHMFHLCFREGLVALFQQQLFSVFGWTINKGILSILFRNSARLRHFKI